MRKTALTIICMLLLTGCNPGESYDKGYDDGYEAGKEEYMNTVDDYTPISDVFSENEIKEFVWENYPIYDVYDTDSMIECLENNGYVVIHADDYYTDETED